MPSAFVLCWGDRPNSPIWAGTRSVFATRASPWTSSICHESRLLPLESDTVNPNMQKQIRTLVESNKVMIFMKGTPADPQCSFSAAVVHIFDQLNVSYQTYNVLTDSCLREEVKPYSQWPSMPQVFINGRFIGSSHTVRDLYERGKLQILLGL